MKSLSESLLQESIGFNIPTRVKSNDWRNCVYGINRVIRESQPKKIYFLFDNSGSVIPEQKRMWMTIMDEMLDDIRFLYKDNSVDIEVLVFNDRIYPIKEIKDIRAQIGYGQLSDLYKNLESALSKPGGYTANIESIADGMRKAEPDSVFVYFTDYIQDAASYKGRKSYKHVIVTDGLQFNVI